MIFKSTLCLLGSVFILTACQTHTARATEKSGESTPVDKVDLGVHGWSERVILLFAANSDVEAYQRMRDDLAKNEAGLSERVLVVYHLFFDEVGHVGEVAISPAAASALGKQFDAPRDGFTFVLLGKDGLEKLRSEEAIAVERIFETVDSMPMRQREMRR